MMAPTEIKSDICVFACTGQKGRNVARLIIEHGGTTVRTLLLAGRDVDKVRALHHELMIVRHQNSMAVKVMAYPTPVRVDDDEALQALASQTRVLVNCVDLSAHPRAQVGVVEACINAGTHYLDLASTFGRLATVFALKTSDKSAIVPGCGFDYALPDVAIAVAERSFQTIYGENPTCVQLLFKMRTGPLGIKWPLQFVSRYFLHRKQPSQASNTRVEAPLILIPRVKAPVLTYSKQLTSWTMPWFQARDALQFLYYQRTGRATIDARLALPKPWWRAMFYVIYTLVVLVPVLAIVVFAKVSRFYKLQRFILYLLPALSLGILTNDDDLRHRAERETCADFVIILQGRDRVFTYRVSGQAAGHITHLCLTLAALELAERRNESGGILTPAQALLNTGFWTQLQRVAELEVHSYE